METVLKNRIEAVDELLLIVWRVHRTCIMISQFLFVFEKPLFHCVAAIRLDGLNEWKCTIYFQEKEKKTFLLRFWSSEMAEMAFTLTVTLYLMLAQQLNAIFYFLLQTHITLIIRAVLVWRWCRPTPNTSWCLCSNNVTNCFHFWDINDVLCMHWNCIFFFLTLKSTRQICVISKYYFYMKWH